MPRLQKPTWKKFTALAVSLLVLAPFGRWLYACADGPDPYDYFTSFFLDDLNKNPAYLPFHYSSQVSYYDDAWGFGDTLEAVPDANITEWQAYTRAAISAKDAEEFLYSFPYSALQSLYNHLEKSTLLSVPDTVARNSFTRYFQSSADLEALGYLMYAKQCEPYATNGGDEWSVPERDTARMGRLVRNGLQLHHAAKKDFIRWRFSYQIIRMAFYAGQYRRALQLYADLVGDKTDSGIMYARCVGLKAGALFRTKQKTQAAYWFSRAFDLSDEMKRKAYISYNWATGAHTEDVLLLCKSTHEKAVVYVMDGLMHYDEEGNDGLRLMQSAAAADPGVSGLDVVMTREINRLEEKLLTQSLYENRGFGGGGYFYNFPYGQASSKALQEWKTEESGLLKYAASMADFARGRANMANAVTPAFWRLSEAYLEYLARNPIACKAALDKASGLKLTGRLKDQHDIILALWYVQQRPQLDAAAEAELLPALQWMQQRRDGDRRMDKAYRNLLQSVLTTTYLNQGDTTKAVLALSKLKENELKKTIKYDEDYSEEYLEDFQDEPGGLLQTVSITGLQRLSAFAAANNKTPFETWLLKDNIYTPSVLSEVTGTRYLRQQDFDAAQAAFAQVKPGEMKYRMLGDPFAYHIRDYQERDRNDSLAGINKLQFSQQMAALKEQASATGASAEILYRYGLGLYAMTYYGRASNATTYYRSGSDMLGYFAVKKRAALPLAERHYYDASAALPVFERAFNMATGQPELQARCAYMAALCWQKNCPFTGVENDYYMDDKAMEYYYYNSLKNPWFAKLKALRSTAAAQVARTECSYLRDYLK